MDFHSFLVQESPSITTAVCSPIELPPDTIKTSKFTYKCFGYFWFCAYKNVYIFSLIIFLMYWFPKTKMGKISFWLVIFGILVIILMNIMSTIMSRNDICDAEGCEPAPGDWELNFVFMFFTRIFISLLAMGCVVIAGITSIIAITKYRDRAILLFLSALLGIMGIMFVLGEILVPH